MAAKRHPILKWAHHPVEIKTALVALGWRPVIKCCYLNSQKFMLDCYREFPELFARLEYREGWVNVDIGSHSVPIEHAWLMLDGEVLDLTIEATRCEYLRYHTYSVERIGANIAYSDSWGFIDPVALASISPYIQREEVI